MAVDSSLGRLLKSSLEALTVHLALELVLKKGVHKWDEAIAYRGFHTIRVSWSSLEYWVVGERVAAITEDQFSRFSFKTAEEVLEFLLGVRSHGNE